jgi:hypothetical protein
MQWVPINCSNLTLLFYLLKIIENSFILILIFCLYSLPLIDFIDFVLDDLNMEVIIIITLNFNLFVFHYIIQ